MTMPRPNHERDTSAFRRIVALNTEQQTIYKMAVTRPQGLTIIEKIRLAQIHREIALAQDERNRARCGAPPAPPDYDPLAEPPVFINQVEASEAGYTKTCEVEVREMRRLYNDEQMSPVAIWREFSHLTESTVRDILRNRTWYDPNYKPRKAERSRKPRQRKVRDVVKKRVHQRRTDS